MKAKQWSDWRIFSASARRDDPAMAEMASILSVGFLERWYRWYTIRMLQKMYDDTL